MGKDTFSQETYTRVHQDATQGGTRRATHQAEEKAQAGLGLDPLVDPKGPPHLGPIRRSLPRFDKDGNLYLMTRGVPMAVEQVVDTTGSMGDNVELAFDALPHSYEMLAAGKVPVLGRYDVQCASAIFNDVEDGEGVAVLARTQFEMDEKIAHQMTMLPPGKDGHGNSKEDSHFAIFAGAYFTSAACFERWGLRSYHFLTSDEPTVLRFSLAWLKKLFGDDLFDHLKENGYNFSARSLPDTHDAVMELQRKAHAFFLQVSGYRNVTAQWTELYGSDHVVMLPMDRGTEYLHAAQALIIGLTEGVLDLTTSVDFLREHDVPKKYANELVEAVAHIPLAAQTLAPNFNNIPKAGDYFRERTDTWPLTEEELAKLRAADKEGKKPKGKGKQKTKAATQPEEPTSDWL